MLRSFGPRSSFAAIIVHRIGRRFFRPSGFLQHHLQLVRSQQRLPDSNHRSQKNSPASFSLQTFSNPAPQSIESLGHAT